MPLFSELLPFLQTGGRVDNMQPYGYSTADCAQGAGEEGKGWGRREGDGQNARRDIKVYILF